MGVYSIGVDIVEVNRIRDMVDRHGERFLNRIFTAHEINYCRRKATYAESYAARFAAKEAVFKAVGTGLRLGIHWQDVEVVNDRSGKPLLRLHGVTAEKLAGMHLHLSLSHTGNMAISMVVIAEQ